MDAHKIVDLARLYRVRLQNMKIVPAEFPHDQLLPISLPPQAMKDALSNASYILNEIEHHAWGDETETALHKLGQVQGILWSFGLYTEDELDSHNAQP